MKQIPAILCGKYSQYLLNLAKATHQLQTQYHSDLTAIGRAILQDPSVSNPNIVATWAKLAMTFCASPRSSKLSFCVKDPLSHNDNDVFRMITFKNFGFQQFNEKKITYTDYKSSRYYGKERKRRISIKSLGKGNIYHYIHPYQIEHIVNSDMQSGMRDLVYIRSALDKAVAELISPIQICTKVTGHSIKKINEISSTDCARVTNKYAADEVPFQDTRLYKILNADDIPVDVEYIYVLPNLGQSIWNFDRSHPLSYMLATYYDMYATNSASYSSYYSNDSYIIVLTDKHGNIIDIISLLNNANLPSHLVAGTENHIKLPSHDYIPCGMYHILRFYNSKASNASDMYIPAIIDILKQNKKTIKNKLSQFNDKIQLAHKAMLAVQHRHAHLVFNNDF